MYSSVFGLFLFKKRLLDTIWRISQLIISENCFHRSQLFYWFIQSMIYWFTKVHVLCINMFIRPMNWYLTWFILHKQLGVWIMCWSGGFLLLSNSIVLHWHFVSASFEGLLPIHCLATSFLKLFYVLSMIIWLLFICLLKGNSHGDLDQMNDWLNICKAKFILLTKTTANEQFYEIILIAKSWELSISDCTFSCHTRIL